MNPHFVRKYWQSFFAIAGVALLLISCQSTSNTAGVNFTPDTNGLSASMMNASPERSAQQRELEGYVAETSARRTMRLPKDLDLTLSGALKTSKKVEFSEEEYHGHLLPYRLTDYSREARYRPIFNDRYNAAPGIK
jgi:hypothetical protein